jgi:asparagine synthase (glutamine-hydrolysing)
MLGNSMPIMASDYLHEMNKRIQHRGPDDQGTFIDTERGLALGHLRLSIIDLSAGGHQPMIDPSGDKIVFNGEIFNYKELKKYLPEYSFKTESDTEILLQLYRKYGHSALQYLNGMFAFAFFDQTKNELLLARDRAGKKPLYYSTKNGIFTFSSEIKALLTLPWIDAKPDDKALYNFLTFNHLDVPQTMFEGIYKLGPGELMTVDKNGIKEHRSYYEINYQNLNYQTEKQLEDAVFNAIDKSVEYRMVADVPVGAFLSGGVDSSAVVALMRKYSSNTIKTFSVGFDGQPDYDERIYAQQISKMFNTEHYEKIVTKTDIEEFLPAIVEIFDEPMADATCIPIYFISQLAKQHQTIVVQTGDGADELFAGYKGWMKYQNLYPWYHRYELLPAFLRNGFSKLLSYSENESPANEIIHRAAKNQELFWGGAKAFKESTKRNFLSNEWKSKIGNIDSYSVIKKRRDEFSLLQKKYPWLNDTDWMCYLGYKYLIPSKYLYRMDRLGMANSIEIRNPFLDFNLVDLALSVPPSFKVKNGIPKYILKKSLERILPNEILYRKKMGFCVPLKEWSSEIMIQQIEEKMHSFCSNYGIFKEEGLKLHIAEIKKGNTSYTNNLWTVFFLINWFEKWMGGSK